MSERTETGTEGQGVPSGRGPDVDRLRAAAIALLDQFDAVEIVAIRHEGDDEGTNAFRAGVGNWYARYGAVRETLAYMDRAAGPDCDKD